MKYIHWAWVSSFLTIGCLGWSIAPVAAQEPIRVGIYENKPKVFTSKSGEPAGFWPEVLDQIAIAEDLTLEYVPCEWEACLDALAVGQLDLMLDVSYIEEREARFDFNQEVVVSSWSVVYVPEGTSVNSIVELHNLRLGVLDSGVQHQDLAKQAERFDISPQFVPVSDYDVMLQWLDEGKLDAGVLNKFTGAVAEANYPIEKTNILIAPTQVHFAVPEGENGDLLAAIDRQLVLLKADQESSYYRSLDRWMTEAEPLSWIEIRRWLLLPAVVVLGSSAIAVLLWNRRLHREIDRRKQTEAALTDSEAWLQRVLAAAAIVCWEEDLTTGEIRHFGLHTETGWRPAHWRVSRQKMWDTIVHPEDIEQVQAARYQAIESRGELKVEHRIVLPNRQVMWILAIGQVITDAANNPLQIVGSSFDITERKEAELSLLTNEEQLRLSLELTNIGTWDWQVGSDHIHWCDNHFQLMGYAPGAFEPEFQLWHDAVHPEDRERVMQAFARALCEQSEYLEEYRIVHPDGSIRWVLGHGRGIQNARNQTRRMLGVTLDITERKETEEALRKSERTKQQILEAIPDLLLWLNVDGTCEGMAGGSGVDNFFPVENAIGKNQYDFLPTSVVEARRAAIAAVQKTGRMQVYEQQIELNGVLQYEEIRVVPIEANTVLVIIRNVSDRKWAEVALAESERRYRIVTESMTDLVCLHGHDDRFDYVTPSCKTLLGYTQTELMQERPAAFIHPDDQVQIEAAYTAAREGKTLPVTYRFRHKRGGYIWLETLTQPILDDAGHILHLQTTSRDISDRVLIEQQLRHDALHDSLTDLPNRLLLLDRLEAALARVNNRPDFQFAVLFVDCDRFKVINDSLGHSAGDQLLTSIAQKFRSLIRDTDLVARLGGDEFVFLLEDITAGSEAVQVAKRVINELQAPFHIEGHQIFTSASIGIVLGTPDYTQAETLLRNADIAMYQAKAMGRATYAIFDPAMHTQVMNHLQIENDLRQAVKNQEFVLFYQPIVSLQTLQVVGFETLVRWQHPTLGLMTPDKFINIVEETDLINPLGEWILFNACQQVSIWQNRIAGAANLRLSVNLSVKQLRESVLIPQLQRVLLNTPINPQTLSLEITESLLVENIDLTCKLLNQVQAMGVSISVDDFGTGYSSLSYLHQLPVDSLKVDRAFVSPSGPSSRNQTIAESIIGLSHLLEMNAIAEGIETTEQLAWLQSRQCEYGQGYLFSKPVSAADAEQLLQQTQGFAHVLQSATPT